MTEEKPIKYYGRRRSLIRQIGSFLPLKPVSKVYVSVTPLHSMTSSMINEESSENCANNFNGLDFGCNGLFQNKPDLLEPISFGSEVRLLALEQELQDLREQICSMVKSDQHGTPQPCLPNESHNNIAAQPPPPPPLPPTTPHIARRASLQEHVTEKPMAKNYQTQKQTLANMDQIKLKPTSKSQGDHPLKSRRESSPCNDLQDILKKKYLEMQHPAGKNSSINPGSDERF